jgi:hypothetical protein
MFAGNQQQRFTWFGFQFVRARRRGRLLGVLPLYAEILGLAPVTGPIAFPWIPGRVDTVPPNPRKRDADGSEGYAATKQRLYRPAQPSVWSLSNHTVKPGNR